ncbi:MAG TPA: hypothetical protein VG454_02035 [Gemmatimonadales bacterium]|nr:hypothetical protein [Gemmatimonadales bacterium]
MTAPDDSRAARSRRLLLAFSFVVVALMIAGGISFVRYARRHKPNPLLVAVAPFDIFVSGLESWRVALAEGVTAQLDSLPPLSAIPQAVVRERWQGQSRPEVAAVDLARRTSAGLAIYGRLDPLTASRDSVRAQMIVIDAGTGRVLIGVDRHWPTARLDDLARALALQVRQNYRYPSD